MFDMYVCNASCDPHFDGSKCKVSAVTSTLLLQAGYQIDIVGIQCLTTGAVTKFCRVTDLLTVEILDHTFREARTLRTGLSLDASTHMTSWTSHKCLRDQYALLPLACVCTCVYLYIHLCRHAHKLVNNGIKFLKKNFR